ncbi:hypothetical protein P280DRAFT_96265 [Massarina eburnea CBS 473.64]|uniref:Uncharacterized protein n=1 Tax=Massarina eburnea CBS 473.64 TaxID=1395130 RepID=A0A6A6RRR9_9PLEO|nr:hypothetical protein P280DRAFT_96265 [Massarina eburnea CBS 473.64]
MCACVLLPKWALSVDIEVFSHEPCPGYGYSFKIFTALMSDDLHCRTIHARRRRPNATCVPACGCQPVFGFHWPSGAISMNLQLFESAVGVHLFSPTFTAIRSTARCCWKAVHLICVCAIFCDEILTRICYTQPSWSSLVGLVTFISSFFV